MHRRIRTNQHVPNVGNTKGQVGLPFISKLDSESNSSPDASSGDDDDDGDITDEMDERGPIGLAGGLPLAS